MKSFFTALIPSFFIIAGIIIIYSVTTSGRDTSRYNRALNEIQLCILSKNAATRKQGDIEECYVRIENHLNLKVERHDRR